MALLTLELERERKSPRPWQLNGWAVSTSVRYAFAVAVTILAYALQSLMWELIPPSPTLLFYPAAMWSAWFGGRGPGLLATAISVAVVANRFLPHYASIAIAIPKDAWDLGIFTAVCIAMTVVLARTRIVAREAQAANRAKDEVLALVAHDLRDPLSAISMSAAEIVRSMDRPDAAERTKKAAARIERATRRADDLVRQVLDAATLDAGRFGVERKPELARDLVDEAFALALPHAQARVVSLQIEIDTRTSIFCDRRRTLQVLANLIGNAVKFTPAGGRVTIGAEDDAAGVRFFVRDDGPGIADHEVPRIFERYWKGAKAGPGTGLGLHIAKAIVDAHGGKIWVERRAERGATFRFTMPRPRPLNG